MNTVTPSRAIGEHPHHRRFVHDRRLDRLRLSLRQVEGDDRTAAVAENKRGGLAHRP